MQLSLVGLGQARVDLVNPAVQSDLVAVGNHPALFVGMQQRRDGRHEERGAHVGFRQCREDARDADPVAVLTPGHAPDRRAAVAQLVGLVVAVERQRNRAAGPTWPALWFQRSPRAHLVDTPAPFVLWPLPRFHRRISWMLRFMPVTASRPAARDGKRPAVKRRQPLAAPAVLPCNWQPRSGTGGGSGIRQAATGARAIRRWIGRKADALVISEHSFGTLSSSARV